MKKIIILISIFLSFYSCSENDEEKTENNSIIGTWQLTASFINTSLENSGTGEWKGIENGYTVNFKSDGTFNSNRFEACTQGTYTTTNVKLTLIYGCPNFSSGFSEDPRGTFVESYRIEDNELFLSPNYFLCENCSFKFKRIQE